MGWQDWAGALKRFFGGALPDAGYRERHVDTGDGPRLFVRDYAAEGRHGGLPVICLHGLTRNSADFHNLALAIAKRGRRVIVPDMRGRGRSDRDPVPSRYRPDVYANDVAHILDVLGEPRAVFVGTSMGGIIAMRLAA